MDAEQQAFAESVDEPSHGGRSPCLIIARWLLLPILFVIGIWCLLLFPDAILSKVPKLWAPAASAPESYLMPSPQKRVQIFDLGAKVQYFSDHCEGAVLNPACQEVLKKAADILGADKPFTAKQLLAQRDFLAELDDSRSVSDRVLGFFSFVNILWLLAIAGIVCTVGPCIAVMIGPMLKDLASALYENFLRPVAMRLHALGVWEGLAYVFIFLLSAQGSRYPQGADAGTMVGLTGGLLFVPCWFYSTTLHMSSSDGDKTSFLMLSHFLVAIDLIPLALIHQSSLVGFCAILAIYGGLGFIFLAFGFGFLIGFDSKDALNRCIIASVVLIAAFTGFRVLGRSPAWVKPFAFGGMCLGNVMYFLALLIATGGWRKNLSDWWKMQVVMALSLLSALLIGCVYGIPAMTNTASTFLVLWLMEKQLEVDFRGFGIVVVFFNCVGLFGISLWLNHHPDFIVSVFDGTGVYM